MTTFSRYLEFLGEAVGTMTERGLLEAMFTDLDDPGPRLIYADYLEDHEEYALAKRMRDPIGHNPTVLS